MRLAFAAIALAFGSPAYGQAVGAEAYLYGQIPIPPQAIAENYIEQVILPGLPPELGPLWLEAKEPGQSLDAAIDTYFSSRRSAPTPELRQAYLQTLLLLNQLRNAIGIREQRAMTPDSYSARAGEAGFIPAEARTDYLAHAATYLAGGDNPQQAALKAAVTWLHDRERQRGAMVQECYFENPQTAMHGFCVNTMMGIDQVYRDVTMAEMFPLNEDVVRQLLTVRFGTVTEEMYRGRGSVIDAISFMLLEPCARGASSNSCWPNGDFRRHRDAAILSALERQEEYRAALLQRQSQIAEAARARVDAERVTVLNGPLTGFLRTIAAGMVVMYVLETGARERRAAANAADPRWIGHEQDEWCYLVYVTYMDGFLQTNTSCMAYDGWIRTMSGADGSLFGSLGAAFNRDPCFEMQGWCPRKE